MKSQQVACLLAALGLAGCQIPRFGNSLFGSLGAPGGGTLLGAPSSNGSAPGALGGDLLVPNAALISNNAAVLVTASTGQLIISNNPAGLAQVGGAAFFALQDLPASPTGGILVALENLAGTQVISQTTTDAKGHFQFDRSPTGNAPDLLRAFFKISTQAYVYQTVLSPGSTTANIDTASTIVSQTVAPLLASGSVSAQDAQAPYSHFVAAVSTDLSAGTVPYMAAQSPDISAFLDQLVEDDATVSQAASPFMPSGTGSLAPPPGAVRYPSVVRTILTSDQALSLGLATSSEPILEDAGNFDVDSQGDLYIPTYSYTDSGATTSIEIVKYDPATGAQAVYATLPSNIVSPVLLALSPTGTLYAMGRDPQTSYRNVYEGAGLMNYVGTMSFNYPGTLKKARDRMAVDASGRVYVSDSVYDVIRTLDPGASSGHRYAGQFGLPGYQDGPTADALFDDPTSLELGPDGSVFVADHGNNCVRQITPDGNVTTVAGRPGHAYYRNGRGVYSRLDRPIHLTVGLDGSVYIADERLLDIRRLSADGSMFLVAGSGTPAIVDGDGRNASFNHPKFLAHDGLGNLYVEDEASTSAGTSFWAIREISPQ